MTQKQLKQFFEDNGFTVHLFKQDRKQCAEIEMWTSGSVDMIIVLMPFAKEEFINYVNDFDVDEEIDLHRQNKGYCSAFTIRQSVYDFEAFHGKLKSIANKIKEIK